MASFDVTVEYEYLAGDVWVTGGTWFADGVTTGEVETRLKYIKTFFISHKGAAVEANVATYNETIPGPCGVLSGAVTMICTSGDLGCWEAKGMR